MRARPTRTISVTDNPINVRKTPAFANDPDALPVTYATIRYPSGGATLYLLAVNPQATGTLTFNANAATNETVVINGQTFTAVASTSPSAIQFTIGASKEETAASLCDQLNAATTNPLINVATYTVSGAIITITYIVRGTAGNAYTLADSSGGHIDRSAATLTGGGSYAAGQVVDPAADFNDIDQGLERYLVGSTSGPTTATVTDYGA